MSNRAPFNTTVDVYWSPISGLAPAVRLTGVAGRLVWQNNILLVDSIYVTRVAWFTSLTVIQGQGYDPYPDGVLVNYAYSERISGPGGGPPAFTVTAYEMVFLGGFFQYYRYWVSDQPGVFP